MELRNGGRKTSGMTYRNDVLELVRIGHRTAIVGPSIVLALHGNGIASDTVAVL